MHSDFPLFPEQASRMAAQVDHLFFFALGVAVFFSLLIAGMILYLGLKYRRRSPDEVGTPSQPHASATTVLEITWSVIPLLILMVMFFWGARVYFAAARPPADAAEFWVVGKQWMWRIQHPEGKREINELHVPLGRPIKLTMTSEDVIHDLFLPAFRIKADVLPGRYTTLWFEANKVGSWHLFCAQYCGAEHSRMVGQIVVMEPHEYQEWLAGRRASGGPSPSGESLFAAKACNTCHRPDSDARAPQLAGLLGRQVRLEGGRSVTADETYVRESIVDPQSKIVEGYQPLMPTFKDQLSEDDIIQLIGYIKTLGAQAGGSGGSGSDAAAGGGEAGGTGGTSRPGAKGVGTDSREPGAGASAGPGESRRRAASTKTAKSGPGTGPADRAGAGSVATPAGHAAAALAEPSAGRGGR